MLIVFPGVNRNRQKKLVMCHTAMSIKCRWEDHDKVLWYYLDSLILQTLIQLSICGTTLIIVFALWMDSPPMHSSTAVGCTAVVKLQIHAATL